MFTRLLIPIVAALLSACGNTFPPSHETGVTVAETPVQIDNTGNTNTPIVTVAPDGALHAFWASGNVIYRKLSTDGGATFGAAAVALDANFLGNITAGSNLPRTLLAQINKNGDTLLAFQASNPSDTTAGSGNTLLPPPSDIYFTHLEAFATPIAKALVSGGESPKNSASARLQVYDPRTQQWEKQPRTALGPDGTAATARWGHGMAVLNGLVYVAGGENTNGFKDVVQRYDPAQDNLGWTLRTPLPAARSGVSLVAAQGYLFAVGGKDASGVHNEIYRYDPTPNSWITAGTLSTARAYAAAAVVVRGTGQVELVVAGGEDAGGTPLADVDHLIVDSSGALSVPATPLGNSGFAARTRAQAVAIGDFVYVTGGHQGGYPLATLDATVRADLVGTPPAWSTLAPMPRPRHSHTAVVLNGRIYLLGGFGLPIGTNPTEPIVGEVDIFDPGQGALGTWRTDPTPPFGNISARAAAVVISGPSEPRNVSRQGNAASQPAMAQDPVTGNLYIGWRDEKANPNNSYSAPVADVYLTRSTDGGITFTDTPVRLSSLGSLGIHVNNHSDYPAVAVDRYGTIHLSWVETGDPTNNGSSPAEDLVYTSCTPDNTAANGIHCAASLAFPSSETRPPGAPPSGELRAPSLAVDDDGTAYLAWVDIAGTLPDAIGSATRIYASNIFFARKTLLSAEFTPIHPVTLDDGLSTLMNTPILVAHGSGEVNALWTTTTEVHFRRLLAGGKTFLTQTGVSFPADAARKDILPFMVLNSATRRLTVLWQSLTNNGLDSTVYTRALDIN